MTYTVLAILLLGVVGASILFIPSGDPETLPDAVLRYSPHDGDIAIDPVKVVIVVKPSYQLSLVIDGITIPASDMNSIEAIGRYQFEPGPGKVIEQWSGGEHTVVATWIGGTAGTDVGTLVWTFRIQ